MKNLKLILISLLSVSLLSLELIWTRIFSAEYFYTFAFLILSLAILGLGLGALTLRLFPNLNKSKNLGRLFILIGLMSLVSPPLVFKIGLDFTTLFSSWLMVGKFVLTLGLLNSSFFFGGIALAMLFKNDHQDMPRLYMADLLGAGAGVLLSVILMNTLGTPFAAYLSAIPVLIAAVLIYKTWMKIVPVMLIVVSVLMGIYASPLLNSARKEIMPVVYEHWDAMARLKMGSYGEEVPYRNINIDNAANTPIAQFDGNWDKPDSLKFEFDVDVSYLMNLNNNRTFLSLGSGGGLDVLQALQAGASEVHAVEVIPHINELMLNGELADYTGRIYHDPRVTVVTEDGRAYVRKFENKFDIIYSLSSNTWASLASGSFALAENYLFTVEAFKDYWQALTNDGFMMLEHQMYMPRLVSEVMIALQEMGIENVNSHFAIYNMPNKRRNILLLSKQPLSDQVREKAFGPVPPGQRNYKYLLYPAADSVKSNLINQIVLKGWKQTADSTRIDISPCRDDRPFVAQLGLWKNFQFDRLKKVLPYEFSGFPISKLNMVIILLVIVGLMIPLNLIPYFRKGEKLKAAPWLYFFIIGMAFMSVEIVLIQKYTLLIGSSVYSLITIVLTVLVASGIGSRFARTVDLKLIFTIIILWLLMDVLIFKHIIYLLGNMPAYTRILATIVLIAPLGFFMGMPFPKGALKVGEMVDWAFAVNGAASVFGSTLIIMIAFSYGYSVSLLVGAILYLISYFLISLKRAW